MQSLREIKTDDLRFNPNILLDTLLAARGLTHARVTRRLEIHPVTWNNYRKNVNSMPVGKLIKLCDMLEVGMEEMYKVLKEGREDND